MQTLPISRSDTPFLEMVMKRMISFVAAGALALGTTALVGCQSNNNPPDSSSNQNPHEGGNGAFGEDPANPGEHSGQQFRNDTGVSPTTQPGSSQNGQ